MKAQDMPKTSRLVLLAIAVMFALAAISSGRLARADSKTDIDRQLLENMGGEAVDDLDRELFAPKKKAAGAEPGKPSAKLSAEAERPGDQIVRDLLQELRRIDAAERAAAKKPMPDESTAAGVSTATAAAEGNPLVDIARKMRDVEQRIGKHDSGPDTQKNQQQIIAQLDRLIEQAKKSCCGGGKPGEKQCEGGTSKRKKVVQSKKPGKGSSPSESSSSAAVKEPAPPSRTDMEHMQVLLKRLWGELPERDREQMLQYPVEQFLPEYELMIEEYYKRLSEAKEDE